jgi:hypothetical protein
VCTLEPHVALQGVLDEPTLSSKHEKSLDTCKSGGTDIHVQRCNSNAAAGGDSGSHVGSGGEEKDRFGCTMQVCRLCCVFGKGSRNEERLTLI